ncbi:cobalamin biosynthesis protein P47K [archaeon]|nr:cobalamin biosynthesis protein P47K [archaeon]|tara:strand:+ start:1337 stop:2215 length:879 start_codon:yes stop_codon:yes gene_type:complete
MKKTPTLIITGYLGSGKTTLLKHILKNSKKKIAIIMNEFGEISIDSKIVKGKNINMTELMNGCVCCSLTGEFEEAIKEVINKIKPELIIVETTGIAEPDALIVDVEKNLKEIYLDSVITIVDVDSIIEFPQISRTTILQIEMADIILLNKVDLITKKQLTLVKTKITKINNKASQIECLNCDVDINLLFSLHEKHWINLKKNKQHTKIETFTFEKDIKFNKSKLEKIIKTLPKEIYRLKGFVNFKNGTFLLNYVSSRFNLEKSNKEKTQLVFIGENIKKYQSEMEKELEKSK